MLSSTSPQSHLHNRRKQRWEKTKQDNRWRKTEKPHTVKWCLELLTQIFRCSTWLRDWSVLKSGQVEISQNYFVMVVFCVVHQVFQLQRMRNEIAFLHNFTCTKRQKEKGYWFKHLMVGILTDELRSGPSERPSNLSKQLLYLYKSKELSVFMLCTIGLNRNNNNERW